MVIAFGKGAKQLSENLKRILVVDDTRAIRSIVRAFLGSAYEFVEAENGRDALQIATRERMDLIISDLSMPEMNGDEFISSLRTRTLAASTRSPVVMLPSQEEKERCLGAGADAFVLKPVTPTALTQVVGDLMGTQHRLAG